MNTLIQFNTLFISILIEAIPFVLISVFIAGIIQIFVTEDMISRIVPKNPVLAVLFGTTVGSIFPACECGIVPIVKRLLTKGVPLAAAIPFMLTGPIINPIVLFSTFVAFGNDWSMVFNRMGLAVSVAITIGLILAFFYRTNPLLESIKEEGKKNELKEETKMSMKQKILAMLKHSIDEFFFIGKFLLAGAAISSAVLVWVPTSFLSSIGQNEYSASLVMMTLSYLLSLCSEADAFIASSFRNTFMPGSLTAFLVFGAMIDVKNTLMMLSTFKVKFVIILTILITGFVFVGSLII